MTRLRLVAAAALLVCTGACNRPYLTWTPREPLSARRGRLAVSVVDQRAGDARVLGRAFGWGGVPRDIEVTSDHVRERVDRLVREAAITAGIGLGVTAEPPTARLQLAIASLRCDGTRLRAEAELTVTWSIAAADGAPIYPEQRVDLRAKASGCEVALQQTLDDLLDELAAKLVELGTRSTPATT